MMALKVYPFDPAEHLQTEEDILYYLEAAMEGNDAKHIASALGDVARSRGMTEIARKAGVGDRRFMLRFPKMETRPWKRLRPFLKRWDWNSPFKNAPHNCVRPCNLCSGMRNIPVLEPRKPS